ADVVDTAVGGGVDFNDVHGGACRDFLADGVVRVEVGLGPAGAIERHGKDARHGRLAGSAGAGKDVAVPDAALVDSVRDRALDVVLADHFVKALGTVF